MRGLSLTLLALVSLPAFSQSASYHVVHSQCPIEATKITPSVYSYHAVSPGEAGWRQASKLALDFKVKNESNRGITAMSFSIAFPHGNILSRSWDDVAVKVDAGAESFLHYNQLIDLVGSIPSVSVVLTKIKYADGEIYDSNCELGIASVPPPLTLVHPTSPSKVFSVGGEVTPPRVIQSYDLAQPMNARQAPVQLVLSTVIEVDGTPQNIQVLSGTLGSQTRDLAAIESLRKWTFTPATMGGAPVAVKISIQVGS